MMKLRSTKVFQYVLANLEIKIKFSFHLDNNVITSMSKVNILVELF